MLVCLQSSLVGQRYLCVSLCHLIVGSLRHQLYTLYCTDYIGLRAFLALLASALLSEVSFHSYSDDAVAYSITFA